MRKKQRKTYTTEFKVKVAPEAIKGQRTINEIAGHYSVHPNQVTQWKKQAILLPNPTNGSWWMVQVQATKTRSSSESHQRQLVDGSSPSYKDALIFRIPPTAVGGWFKSKLQTRWLLPNPTNGSWWMVQVQATKTRSSSESHQRQLVDGSSPSYKHVLFFRIPPNGSWWMVQVRPTSLSQLSYSRSLSQCLIRAVV
jgi:hypothetical protein